MTIRLPVLESKLDATEATSSLKNGRKFSWLYLLSKMTPTATEIQLQEHVSFYLL